MAVKLISSPFGGLARTRVLISLYLIESSFPRELSRLLEIPVSAVSRALAGLERDALVAGRLFGRTRIYTLNPRYFAAAELAEYLRRVADGDPQLRTRASQLRRRPRRTGKPL